MGHDIDRCANRNNVPCVENYNGRVGVDHDPREGDNKGPCVRDI